MCSQSLLLGMRSELLSLMFFGISWCGTLRLFLDMPSFFGLLLRIRTAWPFRINFKGLISQAKSLMCNDPIETIDHLFFSCPVAKGVWATVYNQCCLNWSPGCWESELLWAANQFKGKGFWLGKLRGVLPSTIFGEREMPACIRLNTNARKRFLKL